jgi:hypothetical protein
MKPDSEPYEITVAIADAFQKEALKNNVTPYVIIIPGEEHLGGYKDNFFWKDFLNELTRRKIKYLDLAPELFKERGKDLYRGHFSEVGSEIAADIVCRFFINEKTFEAKTYN